MRIGHLKLVIISMLGLWIMNRHTLREIAYAHTLRATVEIQLKN